MNSAYTLLLAMVKPPPPQEDPCLDIIELRDLLNKEESDLVLFNHYPALLPRKTHQLAKNSHCLALFLISNSLLNSKDQDCLGKTFARLSAHSSFPSSDQCCGNCNTMAHSSVFCPWPERCSNCMAWGHTCSNCACKVRPQHESLHTYFELPFKKYVTVGGWWISANCETNCYEEYRGLECQITSVT